MDFAQELHAAGLDSQAITLHRQRLTAAVARGEKPHFKVVDTCRTDNGGLLQDHALETLLAAGAPELNDPVGNGLVAFVPAAGAASRYSQPLASLVEALGQGNGADMIHCLHQLRAEGAEAWPLPPAAHELLLNPQQALELNAAQRASVAIMLQLPKALMPCVREGTSFLELKTREHEAISGLLGDVYITPPGATSAFKATLGQRPSTQATRQISYLEQGPQLSTLRFHRDGTAYRDENGQLSVVPAGHGALATLFPEVRVEFPRAHSLFIRNIDNVMGISPASLAATDRFLTLYQTILATLKRVRGALIEDRLNEAAELARPLTSLIHPQVARQKSEAFLRSLGSPSERLLWEVQLKLFHTLVPEAALTDDRLRPYLLARLYERPFNLLGQVPNSGKDVGGTPCFVQTARGIEKVCIEVPHVSDCDRAAYLADPQRATHFNPVFAACEIPAEPSYYDEQNQEFWLLAEKTYRGVPVIYYETVLYELIGNSGTANTLFVGVSRAVFNPHKALKDAVNRSLYDWGLS